MSVQYYAYAVIGCELPVDKLYRLTRTQHTEHKVSAGMKFCPQCGKPVWTEQEVPIFDEDKNKLGDLDLIWSTDREQAFVGLVVWCETHGTKSYRRKILPLAVIKTWLRKELEPFDLWDEDSFGLYAVLRRSY